MYSTAHYGYTENASSNLNYVKDNFTRVGDKWETNFYDVKDYKIIAEYKSVDGEGNIVGGSKGTYSLFYYLAKADK